MPETTKANNANSTAATKPKRGPGRPRKTEGTATRKKTTPRKTAPKAAKETKTKAVREHKDRLFALDIGTRSVIGIVAEKESDGLLHIVATERQEHKTRAMLDGQIHDVPQVAEVIKNVKDALVKDTGPLHDAAVAAAGRALYTMTAEAEMDVNGLITAEMQRNLDFAGVQAAQAKLSTSHAVDDPTRYYCVGYSTIRYVLDDIPLKSLVGQRGHKAKAVVITTFLPRQVIDSMQSALHFTKLEMRALTLEPIAAINVLIPPTMRHLNLVLVDIGAGTSDVAITKNGSVVAYGMVPLAGDEITEAISQKFLLDFNVAERIKRQASQGEDVTFSDILGQEYSLKASEVIGPIMPNIENLAAAISKQILELNGDAPQAVMLVGGGSLTPHLQESVAGALGMPENRVAVRRPDQVDGVADIPEELHSPDAVTPLGILKIASLNTLHFLSVYVNDEETSLFNFRDLTVSDALLNAGLSLRDFNGRPGLGLMVNVGGERKMFPGTMGTLAKITLDGEEADLDSIVHDGSRITITRGEDGQVPEVHLSDVAGDTGEFVLYINGREKILNQFATVNGEKQPGDYLLQDGDVVESREFHSLGEALNAAGYPPTGRHIHYVLNGNDTTYACSPEILLNDMPASISMPIHEGDHVEYSVDDAPKLGDVLSLSDTKTEITIYYNNAEYQIPSASFELLVNGRRASAGTIIDEGAEVTFHRSERRATTVSDALVAVDFQPPAATSRMKFEIRVNGQPVDFTAPIKNGDNLEIEFTPIEPPQPPQPPQPTHVVLPGEEPQPVETPVETPVMGKPAGGITGVPTLSAINAGAANPARPQERPHFSWMRHEAPKPQPEPPQQPEPKPQPQTEHVSPFARFGISRPPSTPQQKPVPHIPGMPTPPDHH